MLLYGNDKCIDENLLLISAVILLNHRNILGLHSAMVTLSYAVESRDKQLLKRKGSFTLQLY